MERRACGKSGIEISLLGVGAWSFGGGEDDYWGAQDQAEVERLVNTALDSGINYFDTAEMYNNGRSEIALGKALSSRRDEAVVGSKIIPENCTPSAIREHCEASLQRLGMETVDIYMVHWPIQGYSVEDAFATLLELRSEGKLRSIGVSNFTGRHMAEAADAGAELSVNQLHYSLFSRAIEYEALPYAGEHDVGVVAYMPLLQGILTGKFRGPEGTPWYRMRTRHFSGGREGARHGTPGAEEELWAAVDAIRGLSEELGEPMADVALSWVAAQPGVTCVLAGARNVGQLQRNARGVSLELDAGTLQRLDEITAPLKAKLGPDLDYWQSPEESRAR